MSNALETDPMPSITGERIAALMWRHRYTVKGLADAIGKGRSSVSVKLNGHARWYLDELVSVADALNTTVGYLLGETNDDARPDHLGRNHTKAPASNETGADDLSRLRESNSRPFHYE
ncbi:helix-turn-helix domain-containing protein [Leucobacter chinensis]|uniref:helix-turn-helix domain-containing protein n=1 Tax=Leucobacter chinensis TaxID=2851010 RepID=UPI001C210119